MEWYEPRLILQTPPREFNEAQLRDYISCARKFADNVNGPFAVITDLSQLRASTVDSSMRSLYAEHQRAIATKDAEHCAVSAIIVKDALQRGVISAIFWLSPPVYPYTMVSDLESALAFAREALANAVARVERTNAARRSGSSW